MNVKGLLIAVALGLAGATLNWFYLDQRSRDVEKVSFIGIKDGTTIRHGDVLSESQLVPVEIPRNATGTLKDFAYYWHDLATVVGQSPNRSYVGGELLLRQDMKTPPSELKLTGENERALSIPVDLSSFIPAFLVPGRKVDFLVSRSESFGTPTPAGGGESVAGPPVVHENSEIIGPFKVLSLGNRLGSQEVMQASHITQVQENVMTISVQVEGNQLEPKAMKLWEALRRTNFRGVGVLLHPANERDD